MRSSAEVLFRLRQEAANLRLYLFPPRTVPPVSPLPLPARDAIARRLRDAAFAGRITTLAEQICAHRIPLLGYEIEAGPQIRWRRDYVHDRETPPMYFRRVAYLAPERSGDHKIIWELNRHQHLVALAQAHLLSGRAEFLNETAAQLESWLEQNPLCAGINWSSALEVAFRSLSWIWIHHLLGDRLPPALAARWLRSLYHHGCYLESNLSIYFSPNTHLQGEALALHALGLMFGVEPWRARGAELTEQMMMEHVHPDGGHFEQSSYYHVYSTDMFLFHAILAPPSSAYRASLSRMAKYLWAFAASGEMPMFGDDDGGRLFHPFGDRSRFARATLAACASFLGDTPSHGDAADLDEIAVWWLGERAVASSPAPRISESFRETGVVTMVEGGTEIVASIRAFGPGNAGHSHAHALHFTLRHAGEAVLIDPGTYTYVADPGWRDRFRSTGAHNTVRIDSRPQADPAGPFRWLHVPPGEILEFQLRPWRLRARCRYRGVTHERLMIFADDALWIVDHVSGTGRHRVEQFWHPAAGVEWRGGQSIRLNAGVRLILAGGRAIDIEEGGEFGWRSPLPGVKQPATVIRTDLETDLPCRLVAVFDFRGGEEPLVAEENRLRLGDRQIVL